jgi:4-amino-4-deoxy-L-arabinose transferase-like glycosyltransferase
VRRSRRIPLPLLAVLAVVLVEGLAWTFAVPALQGADEGAHFSYVQKVADAHDIPWRDPKLGYLEPGYPPSVSTEQQIAWLWAGLEPLRGNRAARPLWTHEDERIWARENAKLTDEDRKDGVGSRVFDNPPLYYLTAVVPYEIAGGTFFDRLYALRLYNVALLLAAVALTWLLAGELFGRRRELQTLATAAVALHPVLLDVATRVTPDVLLLTLAAAALYLMTLVVKRGPSWKLVGGLLAVVAAACFTQGRSLGLIAPALFAIGLGWWRSRGSPRPGLLARIPAVVPWTAGAIVVLVVLAAYATRFDFGELAGFWSYLWQFYLPPLPGMSDPIGVSWDVENVYLNRFFGTFVQFEVAFPQDLLDAIRIAVWLGLALLVVSAWRHRRVLWERRDVVAVLLVAFVLSVLALHAAAFRSLLGNPADPVITGRYLLMLIPLFGLAVAAAVAALPGRVRGFAAGGLLGAMFLLQLSAFGLVVERFYA